MQYVCSLGAPSILAGNELVGPRAGKARADAERERPTENCVAVRAALSGNGLRLVATQLIRRGTLIIEEAPKFRKPPQGQPAQLPPSVDYEVPSALWDSAASDILDDFVTNSPQVAARAPAAASQLPQRLRVKGPLPCTSFPDLDVDAEVYRESNRTAAAEERADYGQIQAQAGSTEHRRGFAAMPRGAFPLVACIRHSCSPNAHASWNSAERKEVVYALKDIASGEDIEIAYVPLSADSLSRKQQLAERYGFDCECPVCSLPPEKLRRSDRRRRHLAALDDAIPALAERWPAEAIKAVEDLAKLLDRESILDTSLKARAYYDAFQVCLSHPTVGEARHFARLAFENYLICRGPTSPCTLRLYGYMLNPEAHPASRTARRCAEAILRSNQAKDARQSRRRPKAPKRQQEAQDTTTMRPAQPSEPFSRYGPEAATAAEESTALPVRDPASVGVESSNPLGSETTFSQRLRPQRALAAGKELWQRSQKKLRQKLQVVTGRETEQSVKQYKRPTAWPWIKANSSKQPTLEEQPLYSCEDGICLAGRDADLGSPEEDAPAILLPSHGLADLDSARDLRRDGNWSERILGPIARLTARSERKAKTMAMPPAEPPHRAYAVTLDGRQTGSMEEEELLLGCSQKSDAPTAAAETERVSWQGKIKGSMGFMKKMWGKQKSQAAH